MGARSGARTVADPLRCPVRLRPASARRRRRPRPDPIDRVSPRNRLPPRAWHRCRVTRGCGVGGPLYTGARQIAFAGMAVDRQLPYVGSAGADPVPPPLWDRPGVSPPRTPAGRDDAVRGRRTPDRRPGSRGRLRLSGLQKIDLGGEVDGHDRTALRVRGVDGPSRRGGQRRCAAAAGRTAEGVRATDAIAAEYGRGDAAATLRAAVYLKDNVKHDLGPDEIAGLQRFLDHAATLDLAPRKRRLEFF